MNNLPLVKVQNLSVIFNNQKALKEINLQLYANTINVIIGRSGSGKTTFLRSLNRLNEELGAKTFGQVFIHLQNKWIDIYDPKTDLSLLRQKVGMVFQTPNLLPGSVAHNMTLPVKLLLKYDKKEQQKRMIEALKKVHLWDEVKDRLSTPANTLSGGQQQRLCLARTIALKPKILLLDEPTASLDFQAAQKIENLLLKLKQTYTLIVVSHSLAQTMRLADYLFVFKEGQIIKQFKNRAKIQQGLEQLLDEIF
ncbi:phosphate ABC transporter ATP-binding protein [Desulfovulcanus sp.]